MAENLLYYGDNLRWKSGIRPFKSEVRNAFQRDIGTPYGTEFAGIWCVMESS